MGKVWDLLQGKKSYISAAGIALTALAGLLSGEMDLTTFLLTVFGATGLVGVKSAIKKVEPTDV